MVTFYHMFIMFFYVCFYISGVHFTVYICALCIITVTVTHSKQTAEPHSQGLTQS